MACSSRPIDVVAGATDNLNTEVSAPTLKEGMEIVVGDQIVAEAAGESHDPFMPKMMGGHR